MQRWQLLLGAHNHVLADRGWSAQVRIETCRLLRKKMLSLGPLKPLPAEELPAEKAAKAS
jgi:hypothetical protein